MRNKVSVRIFFLAVGVLALALIFYERSFNNSFRENSTQFSYIVNDVEFKTPMGWALTYDNDFGDGYIKTAAFEKDRTKSNLYFTHFHSGYKLSENRYINNKKYSWDNIEAFELTMGEKDPFYVVLYFPKYNSTMRFSGNILEEIPLFFNKVSRGQTP